MYNILVSQKTQNLLKNYKSNPPELFLDKSVMKICSKITGEHPCLSVISKKLF